MKKLPLIALFVLSLCSCGRKDWNCNATIVNYNDGKTDTIKWNNVYRCKNGFRYYTKTDSENSVFYVVPISSAHLTMDEHIPLVYQGRLEVIEFNCTEKN